MFWISNKDRVKSFIDIVSKCPEVNVGGLYDKIPLCIWRQLPNLAIHILETLGYTRYDKYNDSIRPVKPILNLEKKMEEFHFQVESEANIPINLWRQLSDFTTRILELAGYTRYDRDSDSIIFVEK